jgi:hypothetical protein
MPDYGDCFSSRRTLWNKGKLIGAKSPLRPKHVWSIRTRLLLEREKAGGKVCAAK